MDFHHSSFLALRPVPRHERFGGLDGRAESGTVGPEPWRNPPAGQTGAPGLEADPPEGWTVALLTATATPEIMALELLDELRVG